jgi:hypothetical protein
MVTIPHVSPLTLPYRQRYRKHRSFIFFTVDSDRTAMPPDNIGGDVQAQAQTGTLADQRIIRPVKAVEYLPSG